MRLRATARILPLMVVLAVGAASNASAKVRLIQVPAAAPGLEELGLALDHSTRKDGSVVFEANEADLELLARAGIPVETLVEDLESFYATRAQSESELWSSAARGGNGFGFGSMGGYYTWDEVVGKLDEMRAAYPNLITPRQSLGISHEGRDVWMVMISDNPEDHSPAVENEPSMLFTAVTHAREPQGMAVLLYYMFYLLENYGTDPEATYLVNERQLYFVPVLNPDGYLYNQTTDPGGGGFWRKNRRVNGNGTFGVDLNRNYSFNWGYDNSGSSGSPSSDTYRGPAPFSEPETSAIRGFHLGGRIIWNAFHYHSYGNYEIHPFGHLVNAFPPQPDLSYFLLYGGKLSAFNGYTVGNAGQTVGYRVNGDAVDYCYGEVVEKNKVMAFTPEVGNGGDGFWPQPSRIFPLAEENLGPNLYYSWVTGSRAEFVSVTAGPTVPAGATSPVVVALKNDGLGAAATDASLTLATNDAYVTIAEPVQAFPAIPIHTTVNNSADPLEFFVSGSAPNGHVIAFTLTVKQGEVTRATTGFQVSVTGSAGVEPATAPGVNGLVLAARPNPVIVASELSFGLPAAGPARLVLYDVAGRERRSLLSQGAMTAGEHQITFDGRDNSGARLPNGVYVARLEAAGSSTELRLVVLR